VKILWFDHGFSSPAGSGGTRSYDLARSLAEAGHEVTVVCATQFISHSGLTGSYSSGRREGRAGNIRVIEFDLAGGASAISRLKAQLRYAAQLARLAAAAETDMVIATSASLSGIGPALLAKVLRRKPLLFDARSLRSRLDDALGRSSKPATWLVWGLEACVHRLADRVVAAGDHIAEAITARGVGRFDVAVIPRICDSAPGVECETVRPSDRFGSIESGNLVAVFADRFEAEHGLEAVLDAAALLKLRERNDISILLVGDGTKRPMIARAVMKRQLDNVTVAGPLAKQDLAPLFGGCDVGLQLLDNDPRIHDSAAPAAYADYLAAGLPVLINYPGWLAGLIARHECGYAVRPGEPAAFADALEQAADHRDQLAVVAANARALAAGEFDRQTHLDAFRSIVDELHMQSEARAGLLSKRVFDIAAASVGLVILGPLIAALAILVWLSHGRPVLYRDFCPGLFGRPVGVLRFRVLRDAYRPDGGSLSDEERRTMIGDLLRNTRLAGLPMLWNVLRGDLSLVGPAPMPMQGLSRLSSDEFRRQSVRPGLTGWAQLHRDTPGDTVAGDLWYVENRTFKLDLKILLSAMLRPFGFAGMSAKVAPTTGEIDGKGGREDRAAL
jgi:lipopolysaccharide/colanic/teichoic acid biosynthesis glycosyltransferase